MKRLILYFLLIFLFSFSAKVQSQDNQRTKLNEIFTQRGEVYFKFFIADKNEINELTRIISIDNVKGKEVFAYANRKEFDKFLSKGISYTILTPPSMMLDEKELNMGAGTIDKSSRTVWNFYPTYQQYLDYMSGFASTYPAICKIDTIGTSVQGRLILALKISDSVQYQRGKPQFLYTSSIHGDEITGYVLMLHLIDYLLTGYGTDPRITDMINNTQIYINPLANPDGTYHGGNNTVSGATRYNYNGWDLNRNYPDAADGPHPDGDPNWEKETVAFMDFADSNHFVMSMNFHGGAEVFNYPWDTWAKLHADDSWFNFLGREWADTVHKYAPAGYMNDLDNGVTNGYAWYRITGGRQDYMTYFHYGREVTLEISSTKTPPASQLVSFWNYNYRSFLNYLEQVSYGINGQVTDSLTGQPLNAKVSIFNHDIDNSFVFSTLPAGWYYRPIDQGTYNISFSTAGYRTKTIKDVEAIRRGTNRLNVQLAPTNTQVVDKIAKNDWAVFPNPSSGLFKIEFNGQTETAFYMKVVNVVGQTVYSKQVKANGTSAPLDLSFLPKGIYIMIMEADNVLYQRKLILE